jgi:phospholipid/cholesterol/gamma-HCH transport system substrate-binding protein
MPRRSNWRALIPGLVLLAAVVLLVLTILVYARPGALHGDTYRLFVATEAARGVMKGTAVRIAGRDAGKIRSIEFQPPTVDSSRRLVLELEILAEAQRQVRANSVAQIRTGGSLIGSPVLFITVGTTDAPVLENGDTLRSLPQGDTEDVASRLGQASQALPAIMADVKVLAAQLRSAEGSIGAVQIEGGAQLGDLASRASRLQGMTFESDGSIARALDPQSELRRRAASAMARADSLQTLLASDRSTLGRFRRDSTLAMQITEVRNEVAIVRTRLDRASGTAGRVARDDIVSRQLADVQQSLSRLLDDVRHNPMRYLVF